MKKITKKWNDFQKENLQSITDNLLQERYDEYVEKEFALALCLWKFSRGDYFDDNMQRIDFLKKNVISDDVFGSNLVKTVAMIECLPDKVWRRLLWKENIDFMSYESFLRRLTEEQESAIRKAYQSLFGLQTMPKVMKTIGMKLKLLFINEKKEVQKLLDEPRDNFKRYQSKGAWAFNLLGLDFGFSMYPHGNDNDRRITNRKWTRFLSIKEHINDFIVNMESGMYWKLYRSARSNYVIRPNKEVDMKTHVCPGFWMTLILHCIFWIVSPILAITLNVDAIMDWTWWKIPLNIVALITPLWLTVAMIKFFGLLLYKFGKTIFNIEVSPVWINFWTVVWRIVKVILITIGIVIAIVVLIFISGKFYQFRLVATPVIGALLYWLTVIDLIYFMVVFIIGMKKDHFHWYSRIPRFIRWFALLVLFAFVLKLVEVFLLTKIVSAIVLASTWIWGVVSYAPALTLATILITVFIIASIRLATLSFKNERLFARIENLFMISTIIIPILVMILLMWHTGFSLSGMFDYTPGFIKVGLYFFLPLILILLVQRLRINANTVELRYQIQEKARHYTLSPKLLKKRKDLLLADEDEINKIWYFGVSIFGHGSGFLRKFTMEVLLSGKTSKDLPQYKFILNKYDNDEDKFSVLRLLLNGVSVKKLKSGLDHYKQVEKAKEERIEKRREMWMIFFGGTIEVIVFIAMIIFWPFKKIWHFIRFIGIRIGHFFGTLKDIWDLFNKRCPYVSRSKYLG